MSLEYRQQRGSECDAEHLLYTKQWSGTIDRGQRCLRIAWCTFVALHSVTTQNINTNVYHILFNSLGNSVFLLTARLCGYLEKDTELMGMEKQTSLGFPHGSLIIRGSFLPRFTGCLNVGAAGYSKTSDIHNYTV